MKFASRRDIAVLRQVLFWLSNAALLVITWYAALTVTLSRNWLVPSVGAMTWAKLPAYFPGMIVVLILASALYVIRTKRSVLLYRLFFAVELPLLLIAFARVVFNLYPTTVLFLSIVILLSCLAIWYETLWGQKETKFNRMLRPYAFFPYLAACILSGWVFLIWVFWIPYIAWQLLMNLNLLFDIPLEFLFTSWLTLPGMITAAYFFLSPLLAFGMLLWEIRQRQVPRKRLVIFAGILVILGGAFVLDTLEKRGPQADLYEAARTLNITATTTGVTFDEEDLAGISNLNRLRESTERVYLAGLKYPLHQMLSWRGEGFTTPVREVIRQTYCPFGCDSVASTYETLFFPLMYGGNITEDRALAEKVFAYVFDGSLQDEKGDEISQLKNRSILGHIGWNAGWNSVEAGAIKKHTKLVHVDKAEYEVALHHEIGVYTTTATFSFSNTTNTPQEAYLEFLLPDAHAVITDLRLGQKLQLPSTVAPRGAARQVYEQGLARRIDPALLEQVGPRQYRLRVFPIPADTDVSEGVQSVQMEFTAFIPSNGEISVTTPMTTRNLGLDRRTVILGTMLDEDGQHIPMDPLSLRDITDGFALQVENPRSSQKRFSIEGADGLLTFKKTDQAVSSPDVFFLDVSASANTKEVRDLYEDLRKEHEGRADFYAYNFQVRPLSRDEALSFWGPTDTSALVRSLSESAFSGASIMIVKDGSPVEMQAEEAMDIDYSPIGGVGRIDVLVIGEEVPIFKNELTAAAAAAQEVGSVSLVRDPTEDAGFDVTWSEIGSANGTTLVDDPKWREALEDLWAYNQSKALMRTIVNADSWMTAADEMASVALRAHIVNPFASLIAVETERQMQDLENASQNEDKYRADHDIGEVPNQEIFSDQPADEPTLLLLLIASVLAGLGWKVLRLRTSR